MTMTQPSAEAFAAQAAQYLGRPYSEMDCRQLINNMLKAVGLPGSYKGSNALWRDMAWTGTPEEAVKRFGSVPVGALVYILDFDGGEVARGYKDGLGNASHVGVKTGTGLGAIHSSASRGCVCESKFQDKTIPNGGWNRVGLMKQLDYNVAIPDAEQTDSGTSSGQQDKPNAQPSQPSTQSTPTVTTPSTATVHSENGKSVKMRQKPSTSCNLYWDVPNGDVVMVRGSESKGWTPIRWNGRDGYMMSQFLTADEQKPTTPDVVPDVQDTPSNAPEEGKESYSSYAVEFYDLTLEQAEALQAEAPMYKSRIEGRNG